MRFSKNLFGTICLFLLSLTWALESSNTFTECDESEVEYFHNGTYSKYNIEIPLNNFFLDKEYELFKTVFSMQEADFFEDIQKLYNVQVEKVMEIVNRSNKLQNFQSQNIKDKRSIIPRIITKLLLKTVVYTAPVTFSVAAGIASANIVKLVFDGLNVNAQNYSATLVSRELLYNSVKASADSKLMDLERLMNQNKYGDVYFFKEFLIQNHIGDLKFLHSPKVVNNSLQIVAEAKFFSLPGRSCTVYDIGKFQSQDMYFYNAPKKFINDTLVGNCKRNVLNQRFCEPMSYEDVKGTHLQVVGCYQRRTTSHIVFVTKLAKTYKHNFDTLNFPDTGILLFEIRDSTEHILVAGCPASYFSNRHAVISQLNDPHIQEMQDSANRHKKFTTPKPAEQNTTLIGRLANSVSTAFQEDFWGSLVICLIVLLIFLLCCCCVCCFSYTWYFWIWKIM